MLISQPGSDYPLASISLDAGYTRDLILMLTDIHAVLDHLYLDGTRPEIISPAEDYLRESASPYSLPALIDALAEVTGQLSRAERQALGSIRPTRPHPNQPAAIPPPASNPSHPGQGAGPDQRRTPTPAPRMWSHIKGELWGQLGLTRPERYDTKLWMQVRRVVP